MCGSFVPVASRMCSTSLYIHVQLSWPHASISTHMKTAESGSPFLERKITKPLVLIVSHLRETQSSSKAQIESQGICMGNSFFHILSLGLREPPQNVNLPGVLVRRNAIAMDPDAFIAQCLNDLVPQFSSRFVFRDLECQSHSLQ